MRWQQLRCSPFLPRILRGLWPYELHAAGSRTSIGGAGSLVLCMRKTATACHLIVDRYSDTWNPAYPGTHPCGTLLQMRVPLSTRSLTKWTGPSLRSVSASGHRRNERRNERRLVPNAVRLIGAYAKSLGPYLEFWSWLMLTRTVVLHYRNRPYGMVHLSPVSLCAPRCRPSCPREERSANKNREVPAHTDKLLSHASTVVETLYRYAQYQPAQALRDQFTELG